MESKRNTTYGALLAVLILLAGISIKMAFLYAAEVLAMLLICIPGIMIVLNKENRRDEM